ncbi:phage tail protein [Enterobacter kobei]|uniref:glycine-rich domain-containing protein n=1 Tax=Enterobacter kobei TaxID=208224 RepID=UPI00187E7A6F|nr:phage tail protein [Enterobacter kobei]MBE8915080.1 phage tail protein [Enterobacter kobei]
MADRVIVYPGAIPLETDLLYTNKFSMIGLAKLASMIMGTTTYVRGLACTPTSPASMVVNVSAGEIYSLQNVDGTAYSSVSADTTHSILKQGLLMDAVSFTLTAPSTSGYSVNYLIQATYSDTDGGSTVLPYYNATDPSTAWRGPNNSGTAQYTVRQGICTVSIKSGVPATTGTQTTPSPDTGYTSLYVITVAQGASTVVAGNISQASGAPFIPSAGLIDAIQKGTLTYAVDTGTNNAYVVNTTPKIYSPVDGLQITFKTAFSNSGSCTLAFNGLSPVALNSSSNSSLQGGEIPGNTFVTCQWNSSTASWLMISNGGSLPVPSPLRGGHAVNAGIVQANALNYAIDSGVVNAYVISTSAITPNPTGTPANGQQFTFKALTANTGPSTIKIGSFSVAPVVSPSGAALQGGEITANGLSTVQYNSSLSSWTLVSTSGAVQVPTALQSGQAVNLSQLQTYVASQTGRLINIQVFTASGTYTPTSGTKKIRVRLVGGGGGGGSAAGNTNANWVSLGTGGSAGTYGESTIIDATSITTVSVTVGNGGGGGFAGSAGSAGGSSSFGAYIVAPGGAAGGAGGSNSVTTPVFIADGSPTGNCTGTSVLVNIPGGGYLGQVTSSGTTGQGMKGSAGGNSFIGIGGGASQVNTVARAGSGYGSGGAGGVAAQVVSTNVAPGGSGATGIVIVEEYA